MSMRSWWFTFLMWAVLAVIIWNFGSLVGPASVRYPILFEDDPIQSCPLDLPLPSVERDANGILWLICTR